MGARTFVVGKKGLEDLAKRLISIHLLDGCEIGNLMRKDLSRAQLTKMVNFLTDTFECDK